LAAKQGLAIERAFWELCRGLEQEDFAALMNMDDLRMKVYLYNHPKREAFHPEDNQIPWTVMHYLGAKSRKHIYMTGRIPKIDRYNHQIAVMISRIKWIASKKKDEVYNKKIIWSTKRQRNEQIWNLGHRMIPPETNVFVVNSEQRAGRR
jgi:hypothetical protein